MAFEILHGAFVLLGLRARAKGAESAPLAGLAIELARVQAVFSGAQLADHARHSNTNRLPRLPPPGVPIRGPDPDFVCADLDIDMPLWGELMPLSGRTVTVTGTVAPHPAPGACPIYLDHVRVVPR